MSKFLDQQGLKVLWDIVNGKFASLQLRRDYDYNYKDDFVPVKGEVCFVDTAKDGLRFKLGDGVTPFGQLEYYDEANNIIITGYYKDNFFYYDDEFAQPMSGYVNKLYLDSTSGTICYFKGDKYYPLVDLPIASPTAAGIMKLYASSGSNEDGTMTQKTITNELDLKVNKSGFIDKTDDMISQVSIDSEGNVYIDPNDPRFPKNITTYPAGLGYYNVPDWTEDFVEKLTIITQEVNFNENIAYIAGYALASQYGGKGALKLSLNDIIICGPFGMFGSTNNMGMYDIVEKTFTIGPISLTQLASDQIAGLRFTNFGNNLVVTSPAAFGMTEEAAIDNLKRSNMTFGYTGVSVGLFAKSTIDSLISNSIANYMKKGVDYVTAGKKEDTTLGNKATAEGESNEASGGYSHAEGVYNTVTGDYGHAEGSTNTVSAWAAHAEGTMTVAAGTYSHAEGNNTKATYAGAHSEGMSTGAYAIGAHAEGNETIAAGDYAHTEGNLSYATGKFAHAEGYNTKANYESAHAEGNSSNAYGDYSHAEGLGSQTSSSAAHAEGNNTKAIGPNSHSEGHATYAIGDSSHAEGLSTFAQGYASHAEGSNSKANSENSHAEGQSTIASGENSHAEGSFTTASGYESHAEGNSTVASGRSAHAEGESTTASGHYSHAEGSGATASGDYSHAEGSDTNASGYYSHVEGISTIAQREGQHVFGVCNIPDAQGNDTYERGQYVEIVGNGFLFPSLSRSNARTLDWDGNEWLAGKLTIGTHPTDNYDVTTKQYVDDQISSTSGDLTEEINKKVEASVELDDELLVLD